MNAALVRRAFRLGLPVTDEEFDALLPDDLRRPSRRFWSPISVATLVARWLQEVGAKRVLDVGAGPGKLCVVGALTTSLEFTGVEHRAHLHAASVDLAARCGVSAHVNFVRGGLSAVNFEEFDALYLFNPFGENLFGAEEQLDQTVDLGEARFTEDVGHVESAMDRMPLGSRVVTYHGFGGLMPESYSMERSELAGTDIARMWRKTGQDRSMPEGGPTSGSGHGARIRHIRPLGGAPTP